MLYQATITQSIHTEAHRHMKEGPDSVLLMFMLLEMHTVSELRDESFSTL